MSALGIFLRCRGVFEQCWVATHLRKIPVIVVLSAGGLGWRHAPDTREGECVRLESRELDHSHDFSFLLARDCGQITYAL